MAVEITNEFKDKVKKAFFDVNHKAVKAFQIKGLNSIDDLVADDIGVYFITALKDKIKIKYETILKYLVNTQGDIEEAVKNIFDFRRKLKQYKIYKINTFDLFTKEENELYNQHKAEKTLKDFNEILSENKNVRVVSAKALDNIDNEIALFDSDLLRIIRGNDYQVNMPVKDFIYIDIYHNEILKQIVENGFMSNDGKSYEFFTATSGQVRDKCCTFIDSEVLKKNEGAITNGMTDKRINESEFKGANTGKYLAHKGLIMTSSMPIEIDIDRVIVVDDFETFVTDKVEYINTETFKTEIKDMAIPVSHCDGAGMFLPGVLKASCQIRGRWIKGAVFPFDFREFAIDVAGNTVVPDVYGFEHDIIKEDIWIILTKSQFKMWKYYKSWDEYKTYFKQNNLKLSILNETKEHPEQKEAAYQFLQTLDRDKLDDGKIIGLCNDTVNEIKSLYNDSEEMKKILGATEENENLKPLQESLIIYPELLYDKHFKTQIQKTVRSYRREAMAGKILLDGFYSYICPDLYALCERIFQNTQIPKGLLPKGFVYNSFYNDRGETKCDLLRSPHLYNEHCVREFTKDEDCKRWFVGHDTIVSTHDLTQRTLMCDVDGDECLNVTSDKIFDLITPCVPLYYDMFPAEAQEINKKNIYDTLILGFDNNKIGDISNCITKLWNTDDAIIDLDLIKLLQMHNNFTIDYPKTGKNIELTEEILFKYEQLIKEKKSVPYFFQYAKNKKSYNCKLANSSVVNRISKYVKSETTNLRYKPFEDKTKKFTEAMLQNQEEKYKVKRELESYKKLQQALIIWERKLKSLNKKFSDERNKNDEFKTKFDIHYQYCKDELLKIYNNIDLLVNAFVDIEYLQSYNIKRTQRNILWNCFGDILINNIKVNLKSDIELKSRPRLAYSTEDKKQYEGLKSRIVELVVPKSVNITVEDMKLINDFKPIHKNDRLIFYVLTCLCKAFKNKLVLSKGKKTSFYNATSKKKKPIINANTIDNLAGTKTFNQAIKRLEEKHLITVSNEKGKKTISLVSGNDDDIVFSVENIWRPLLYLEKYEGKPVCQCDICGMEYIKKGNTNTCCKACSKELDKRNKRKFYENSKMGIDNVVNE